MKEKMERMDKECISICEVLNRLPDVTTYESCSGHGKEPFNVWFWCDNIDTLSRLGRAVNKNYSDGNWEIVLDSLDTKPRGCFWLRSKSVLPNDVLLGSLEKLEENILFWFKHEFDEYFTNASEGSAMKAHIYFNSKSKGLDYNGEGQYVLVTEDDKCIGSHVSSSRGFAIYDLTERRLKELQENNISEVYSNGKLVWKDQEMTKDGKDEFFKASADYERKYCNLFF